MEETTQTVSLKEKFPYLTDRPTGDFPAYNCPPDKLVELMQALSKECGFEMLADLTAVDNGTNATPRFTCVYHLFSLERTEYLRIAADCTGKDEPSIPSVTGIWGGANWLERVFRADMAKRPPQEARQSFQSFQTLV